MVSYCVVAVLIINITLHAVPLQLVNVQDTMGPLDVDRDQIQETEILEAIQDLKNGKAPGIDGISSELVKHGKEELARLHSN